MGKYMSQHAKTVLGLSLTLLILLSYYISFPSIPVRAGSQYTVALRSRADDGSWTNRGAIFILGIGSVNCGTYISLSTGSYEVISDVPGVFNGALYGFDRWETDGSISTSPKYDTDSFMTVSGSGTLTAVYIKMDFSLDVAPSSQSITAGDTAYYTFTVTRIGDPHDGPNLDISLNLVGSPSGAGYHIGSNPTVLSPGQASASGQFYVVTQDSTTPDSYSLTLTGTVTSTSITHSRTVSLVVNPKEEEKPDLIITGVTWSPQNSEAEQQVTFTYTEKNQGDATATGHRITIWIDDVLISTDIFTGTLGAGESRSNIFPELWTATAGSHTISVKVDSSNGIDESNEDNNFWTGQITVEATELFDFTVDVSPSSQSVERGDAVEYTVTVSLLSGSGTVSLSVSGLPSSDGIWDFDVDSGSPTFTSTLTVGVFQDASVGSYTLTVTGEGGGVSRSDTCTLVVESPPFDFLLGSEPSSGTVHRGESASYTITVTLESGDPQTVSLSLYNAPSWVSYVFSPGSGSPTFTSTLTVTASDSAPIGSSSLYVRGEGGGESRMIAVTLNVVSEEEENQENSPPSIDRISSSLDGPFIPGVRGVWVTYIVMVHDDKQVVKVQFQLGNDIYVDNNPYDGWSWTVDAGAIESDSTLSAVAYDDKGLASEEAEYEVNILNIEIPEVLMVLDITYNEPIYTISIVNLEIKKSVTIPEWIPKVGGEHEIDFGLLVNVEYSLATKEIDIVGEGNAGGKLFGRSASGRVELQGSIDQNTWSLIEVRVFGTISFDVFYEKFSIEGLPSWVPLPKILLKGTATIEVTSIFDKKGLLSLSVSLSGSIEGRILIDEDIGGIPIELSGYAVGTAGITPSWDKVEGITISVEATFEAGAEANIAGITYEITLGPYTWEANSND